MCNAVEIKIRHFWFKSSHTILRNAPANFVGSSTSAQNWATRTREPFSLPCRKKTGSRKFLEIRKGRFIFLSAAEQTAFKQQQRPELGSGNAQEKQTRLHNLTSRRGPPRFFKGPATFKTGFLDFERSPEWPTGRVSFYFLGRSFGRYRYIAAGRLGFQFQPRGGALWRNHSRGAWPPGELRESCQGPRLIGWLQSDSSTVKFEVMHIDKSPWHLQAAYNVCGARNVPFIAPPLWWNVKSWWPRLGISRNCDLSCSRTLSFFEMSNVMFILGKY